MQLSLTSLLAVFFFLGLMACKDKDDVDPTTSITIDGKAYPIVVIGTQTWTSTNYSGTGGMSYDEAGSKPEYGKYYTQTELASIPLPSGWRIPTQQDYTNLAAYYEISLPSHGTDTEAIKKLISQAHWNHVSGTNTSGFNAYPAGYTFGSEPPIDGDIVEFWTSEGITLSIQEAGTDLTSLRMIFYQSDNSIDYRFNVRFVKANSP